MLKPLMMVAALALTAPAQASKPIDERRPLDADGRVSVNNLAGSIEVVAWDRNEVAITGELGEDVEELEISGSARSLTVHVRYPRKLRGSVEETLLRLQVPKSAALELEGVSADIRVSGTDGALSASSVSGDIDVRTKSDEITLNTVSGDVVVEAPASRAELQSVSGDVEARGLRGTVKVETVSGDLSIDGGPFRSVAAESVSGDLQLLALELETGAELRAESLSGQIAVRLSRQPDAEVSLKTFSGSLRSDFGRAGNGDSRKLEQTLGSGKGRIELNSFSGDIYLGKR